MLVIDTEQTRGALSFEQAIPALREAFAQGAHVPARHVHAIDSGGAHGTSLIMPAERTRLFRREGDQYLSREHAPVAAGPARDL